MPLTSWSIKASTLVSLKYAMTRSLAQTVCETPSGSLPSVTISVINATWPARSRYSTYSPRKRPSPRNPAPANEMTSSTTKAPLPKIAPKPASMATYTRPAIHNAPYMMARYTRYGAVCKTIEVARPSCRFIARSSHRSLGHIVADRTCDRLDFTHRRSLPRPQSIPLLLFARSAAPPSSRPILPRLDQAMEPKATRTGTALQAVSAAAVATASVALEAKWECPCLRLLRCPCRPQQ